MSFLIGQLLSIAALIISVVIAQFKDVKHVLLGEIATNLFVALSFVFLGGISGAWIGIVGAVQTIIIYWANKREMSMEKRNVLLGFFVAVCIIGTMTVYQGWNDVVSCACAILYILAIVQTEAKKYRLFMAVGSLLWVIYDISIEAYINIFNHGSVLLSLLAAMIRLDCKKDRRERHIDE